MMMVVIVMLVAATIENLQAPRRFHIEFCCGLIDDFGADFNLGKERMGCFVGEVALVEFDEHFIARACWFDAHIFAIFKGVDYFYQSFL